MNFFWHCHEAASTSISAPFPRRLRSPPRGFFGENRFFAGVINRFRKVINILQELSTFTRIYTTVFPQIITEMQELIQKNVSLHAKIPAAQRAFPKPARSQSRKSRFRSAAPTSLQSRFRRAKLAATPASIVQLRRHARFHRANLAAPLPPRNFAGTPILAEQTSPPHSRRATSPARPLPPHELRRRADPPPFFNHASPPPRRSTRAVRDHEPPSRKCRRIAKGFPTRRARLSCRKKQDCVNCWQNCVLTFPAKCGIIFL